MKHQTGPAVEQPDGTPYLEDTVDPENQITYGGPRPQPEDHEGATEGQVGDRLGPAVGYDTEPSQVKDEGGVR